MSQRSGTTGGVDALRAVGLARFEADDLDGARTSLAAAYAAGAADPVTVDMLHGLHVDAGDRVAADALLDDFLDRVDPDLAPLERARWAVRRFDAHLGGDPAKRKEAALDLLTAAAAAGDAGWGLVQDPRRRAAIDAAFADPLAELELREQEAYAPPGSGLPALAVDRLVVLGHLHAAEPAVARGAERLLHALGERDLAYGVERARRGAAGRLPFGARRPGGADDGGADAGAPDALADLGVRVVVLVGGHPALRRLARTDLLGRGAGEVREVPSAWEASRQGRAVRDVLAQADLAVLIWRQLAHSTADQVTTAARGEGVGVVRARTPSVGAIRRAVADYGAEP